MRRSPDATPSSPQRSDPAAACRRPWRRDSVTGLRQFDQFLIVTVTGALVVAFPAPSLAVRSEEHTSELQSPCNLVCRLLLEKKKKKKEIILMMRLLVVCSVGD